MELQQNKYEQEEKVEVNHLMYRYIPYWPLFILLFLSFGFLAWLYIQFATPKYEITANILIKDEKKGADDPTAVQVINAYASKKLVENEIEVIRSRELFGKIVNDLLLYAPVFEEGLFSSKSAYTSAPIMIEVQKPEQIKDHKKISFQYDQYKSKVSINKKDYPLNEWVATPYGTLKFLKNNNQNSQGAQPFYFSLIHPSKIANSLRNQLDVNQSGKFSTVVTLKLKDEEPERGKKILNGLVDVYNKSAINEKNQMAANTLSIVEDRIKYVSRELDSIEGRVQKYKSQKGVTNLSEQGKLFLESVSDNDRKLANINMQLAVLGQVEKMLVTKGGQTTIVPSTLGFTDPVLTQLFQKLHEAEMQYERLKKTTPDGNPMMFSLKNEIENIKPIILDNIQTQKVSLLASKNDLHITNGMYASRMRTIPENEKELLEISRQQTIKNEAYSFLLQKREETVLSFAASVPDSRIVDRAEASTGPVSPKKMLIYFASLIVAFVVGLVYVNSRELISDKILFRSEVEKLTSIPVVAEIIKVKAKNSLIVNDPKQIVIAEQFRQLRAAIGLFGQNIKHRKLLITSSISGEGKSFVSSNLALSLALSGKRVLFMDMDLRNPRTSEIFGFKNSIGIAEYLMGDCSLDEIVCKTDYNNLYILPAGSVNMNTTELLLNGQVNNLFDRVQTEFDVLIIDAAPVDPVMDAFVLSDYCDFTLLVVRHRYTPKTMIQLLDENNKIKALKNTAIVFNSVKSRGFVKKVYGLGYGYGYMNVYGAKSYNKGSFQ